MGNHVGVERDPAPLEKLLGMGGVGESSNNHNNHHNMGGGLQEEEKRQDKVMKFNNKNNKNEFLATLHVWRFYQDPSDAQQVKITPLFLCESFKAFDPTECYLLLHIYLIEGSKYSRTPPASPSGTIGEQTGGGRGGGEVEDDVTSVSSLIMSANEALTPRGLSKSLGITTNSSMTRTSSGSIESGLGYHVYVWNGKHSGDYTRATALARGIELEKNEKRNLLQGLFYHGEKAALPSLFKLDVPRASSSSSSSSAASADYEGGMANHLFRQLLRRDSSEQSSPFNKPSSLTTSSQSRLNQVFPEPPSSRDAPSPKKSKKSSSGDSSSSGDEASSKSNGKKKKVETPRSSDDSDDDDEPVVKKPVAKPKGLAGRFNIPSLQPIKPLSLDIGGLRGQLAQEADSFTDSENKLKAEKLKKYDTICSKITDELYLGSQTVSRDKKMLKEEGITHILNCAGAICPPYYPNEFVYRTLYLTDGVKEDILCLLYDIIEWMEDVVSKGGKIFVHCQQGVSRSSAMMIGYLMWKKGWDYQVAQMFVKERRGVSSPNPGFICQLLNLAHRLTSNQKDTRLYMIVTHSERHDRNFLVGKNITSFPMNELSGSSKNCYIAQTPDRFLIWVGALCPEHVLEVAHTTVRRVQAFEKVNAKVEVVRQGEETQEQISFLGSVTTKSTAETLALAKKKKVADEST